MNSNSKSMVLGSKKDFAIEYSINQRNPYLMGHVRLWLNNISIGCYDEEVPLLSIQSSLVRLKNRIGELENRDLDTAKSLGQNPMKIIASLDDNGKYMPGLGESFDDFEIYVYKNDEKLNFYWQLVDNPYFNYLSYPQGIMHHSVDVSYFCKVVEEGEDYLSDKG